MIIIIIIIIYFLSVSYQLVTSDASVLPITTRLNNIIYCGVVAETPQGTIEVLYHSPGLVEQHVRLACYNWVIQQANKICWAKVKLMSVRRGEGLDRPSNQVFCIIKVNWSSHFKQMTLLWPQLVTTLKSTPTAPAFAKALQLTAGNLTTTTTTTKTTDYLHEL